jgi:citrate lyase subunit beta/citryl-CoA lyase
MRSKLFVPGSRPELFAKALAGEADALSFDLEDSVVEARKAQARGALSAFVQSDAARAGAKVLIVRVNALETPHFAADVAAVVHPGVHLLNLPKPESVADVLAAVAALEQAERSNGFVPGRDAPVQLLLNIETPKALHVAADLAAAHPRVAGLQLGLGDLFEPLGISRGDVQAVQQVMLMLRLAAGAAGVFAYDGAYANFSDADGYRAEAQAARRLGFLGKSCIHPSQVALANEAFRPDAAEIDHAQRVLQAAAQAESTGTGAYVVDGRMVDRPFVLRAQQIVATASRLGLLPASSSKD